MSPSRNGIGLLLSAAVLLLGGGRLSAQERDEARDLFDRVEKKLAEAKTLHATVEGKFMGGDGGTLKAKLWIALGNKVRIDINMRLGRSSASTMLVSDGTRQRAGPTGMLFTAEDTPKHLGENLAYTLSRIGFSPAFMQSRTRDENKPQKDNMAVSDFRLGKPEDRDGRKVLVLHYRFVLPGDRRKTSTTLFIDEQTLLPVARTVPDYFDLREEYQFQLDEKVPDSRFELPR